MKVWGFVLVNAAIVVAVLTMWIMPTMESLRNGQAVVRSLEGRYFAEQRLLVEFDENLRRFEEIRGEVLAYSEFANALNDVSLLAAGFGLGLVEFVAAEPVGNDVGFGRVFEMRVRALYEGCVYSILDFLYELKKIQTHVRVANVEFQELARLGVEFSLFGM